MCSETFARQTNQSNQSLPETNSMSCNSNSPIIYMERQSHQQQYQHQHQHSNGSCNSQEYLQRNRTPSSPRPTSTAPTPVNYPTIYHPQAIQPQQAIHNTQNLLQEQFVPLNYYLDSHQQLIQSPEFLPLCDLLFNIISLAAYFCDVVFDSVTVYTLYLQRENLWFWLTLILVLCSAIISQILSLKWYCRKQKDKSDLLQQQGLCVLAIHLLQFGVLWRYFKLFIPVDLSSVKHEVRDLCMLRMVHAFTEAAPMLIIQIYLMWLKPDPDDITDLNIISTFLSLFSLCWAMASFSKNVRRQNIHKLVLTWLGVIFQFFWRLGTVTSRVIALSVYAMFYGHWVLVVIALHWFSMLLWLLSPKNLFYGEKMPFAKRFCYSLIVAWVYIFCYINMQEENSCKKMIAFYATMFLENSLLLSVCLFLRSGPSLWFQELAQLFVWGGFATGILFMILYYKFFHIRHLKHTLLASHYDTIEYAASHCPKHGNQQFNDNIQANGSVNDRLVGLEERKLPILGMSSASNGVITAIPGVFNCRLNPALKRKKKKPSSFIPPPAHPSITPANTNLAGKQSQSNNFLNCQTTKTTTHSVKQNVISGSNVVPSPATFWKKSKLGNGFLRPITPATSTSPVPSIPTKHPFSSTIASSPVANFTDLHLVDNKQTRSPVSTLFINDLESGDGGNRIDIQQKLQEKKQQQLMQLKEIEEEIKQGKLKPQVDLRLSPMNHQAVPPQAKKRPSVGSNTTANGHLPFTGSGNRGMHHYYYHPVYRRVKLRSQTPEVLLAPHYLDNSRVFYDYPSCVLPPIPSRLVDMTLHESNENEDEEKEELNSRFKNMTNHINGDAMIKNRNMRNITNKSHGVNNLNSYQQSNKVAISDIDSQVSLPRSYTLPREFRYYRGNGTVNVAINNAAVGETGTNVGVPRYRIRKKNERFNCNVASNSSIDGDVDSDNNQEECDQSPVPQIIRGPVHNVRGAVRPRNYHHHHHHHHHGKYRKNVPETPL